jgi:hypothetical protein
VGSATKQAQSTNRLLWAWQIILTTDLRDLHGRGSLWLSTITDPATGSANSIKLCVTFP